MMAFFRPDRRKLFCVICKRCERNVPAGVQAMPKDYIKVTCILCNEVRLYLPTQVGLDFPHHDVWKKPGVSQWVR